MDKRSQGLLIANGALVLLAGFAAGFPYASAVAASLGANPPEGTVEALRAWHMAHLEGVLNGLLILASAAAAGQLTLLSALAQRVVFWGLIASGWTNIVASSISAMTGGRGMAPTGVDWNTLDFTLFILGVVAAIAAMATLVVAGFRWAPKP